MSRENKTKYAILGLLACCPMSGYDIKNSFKNGMELFWRESYGQIYPFLKSLAQSGLIIEVGGTLQEGRPDKRIYRITDTGREVLQAWLEKPVEPELFRVEILLKLSFAKFTSEKTMLTHIASQRQFYQKLHQDLINVEKRVIEEECHKDNFRYSLATINYGKHLAQAMLDWCDDTHVLLSGAADKNLPED